VQAAADSLVAQRQLLARDAQANVQKAQASAIFE
jgi:hypothetical protein